MSGRPTKLDPELARRIVELVRAGNFLDTAAGTCGIHRTTLYRWLEKGEAESEGPFQDFYLAVMKAQSESEARDLLLISKAATEDWRAAAWRLERRYPRKYGPQVQVTVRQEMESLLVTLRERLLSDTYREVMSVIVGEEDTAKELQ